MTMSEGQASVSGASLLPNDSIWDDLANQVLFG